MNSHYIVGITGGSGSGKTYFINSILKKFSIRDICFISQDNYYRNIHQIPKDMHGIENFDTLEAIDFGQFEIDLKSLMRGESVTLPEYTFNNKNATPKLITLDPAPIIIIEGVFVFAIPRIQEMIDLKVFIEASDILKIKRRVMRDAVERGYDMEDVFYRYEHHVDPAYKKYIEPYKKVSDIILSNENQLEKGLEVVADHLTIKLRQLAS